MAKEAAEREADEQAHMGLRSGHWLLAGFGTIATATDMALFSATDADLAALKDKQDMKSLLVRGPKVTDAGLANLKDLKGLRELDLAYTSVTDAGLSNLKEMTGLQKLNLSSTAMTDAADWSS